MLRNGMPVPLVSLIVEISLVCSWNQNFTCEPRYNSISCFLSFSRVRTTGGAGHRRHYAGGRTGCVQ